MSSQDRQPTGPDFASGFDLAALREGQSVAGYVQGKLVLLARSGGRVFAIGGKCTHYGGPLAKGLIVGETVRCPWHHACFNLSTGEALRAPALNPIPCWRVETSGGKAYVREKLPEGGKNPEPSHGASRSVPASVVI